MWRCRCRSWVCSPNDLVAPQFAARRLISSFAFSQDLLVGLRLRRAARGLRQCADDGAGGQVDLEGIVLISLCVAEKDVGCKGRTGRDGRLNGERDYSARGDSQ